MKWDYWYGPDEEDRREVYADEFLPEYQANGDAVQGKVHACTAMFKAETGIELPEGYSSGWRPRTVNERTANAAKGTSRHLEAKAGDKRDTVNGDYCWWCLRNQYVLEQRGLWMEHPAATVLRAYKTAHEQEREPTPWCHQQVEPPGSGARVYFPDAASVQEWADFLAGGGYIGIAFQDWVGLFGTPKPTPRSRTRVREE